MARRQTYDKKCRPDQALQIGKDDDMQTPFWALRKQVRQRLVLQRPDLTATEIERRVNRIVNRGMRPAA